MAHNLALATLMVGICVTIHFFGLTLLMRALRRRARILKPAKNLFGQGFIVLGVVLGLVLMHTIEIWAYAAAYRAIGAIHDFSTALYFSTTTFTTIGYGDVVLDGDWRLFGAIEAAVGLILFGWSTAFLISVTAYLRAFEHDWLEAEK
ncbi:MAG: two pore domain potassium channel family protein [Alphaproteobacteria bacterium]|nr:two pore domain potassium channel family protein [Alphaproteobacteria bacterium]